MRFGSRPEKPDGSIRQLELSVEDLKTSGGEFNPQKDTEVEVPSATTNPRKTRVRHPPF